MLLNSLDEKDECFSSSSLHLYTVMENPGIWDHIWEDVGEGCKLGLRALAKAFVCFSQHRACIARRTWYGKQFGIDTAAIPLFY